MQRLSHARTAPHRINRESGREKWPHVEHHFWMSLEEWVLPGQERICVLLLHTTKAPDIPAHDSWDGLS